MLKTSTTSVMILAASNAFSAALVQIWKKASLNLLAKREKMFLVRIKEIHQEDQHFVSL